MRTFRYKQNRLQQLKGFCAVVEAHSVSKAADRLSLTQPTVSLQVQSLERDLRTTLFERRGPKIELTFEGALLYELARPLVEGLTALSSRQVVGRVGPAATGGFATGVEVTLAFDEKNYVGTGVFLVASVLERFLGQYASINSFTQLVAKTVQGEGVLKKWPPRVGELSLL